MSDKNEIKRFEDWFEKPNDSYDPDNGFVGSMYDIAKVAWLAARDADKAKIAELEAKVQELVETKQRLIIQNANEFASKVNVDLELKNDELINENQELKAKLERVREFCKKYIADNRYYCTPGDLGLSMNMVEKEMRKILEVLNDGEC